MSRISSAVNQLHVVCGAGGFIGGHLVAELRRRGVGSIRAIDIKPLDEWFQRFDGVENVCADLREPAVCRCACGDAVQVYNLACDMGGMGFIELNKAACMVNVLINTNLLIAARDCGVERYFYSSSACVYPQARQSTTDVEPLKESDAYPADPEDGYGWEKLFSERMCGHFAEEFAMEVTVARLHNVYGPHGSWRGGREKAPAAICRKVIEVVHGDTADIEIWGDGHQTRSFQWIHDCIDGIFHIVASGDSHPVNLGSSSLISIIGLADLVMDIAGRRIERRHVLDAPLGVAGRNSDNTVLRARTGGWEPRTPLREGLAETYRWIENEFLACRT
jgi:GDP-D-mannose 3',5'-epimerase